MKDLDNAFCEVKRLWDSIMTKLTFGPCDLPLLSPYSQLLSGHIAKLLSGILLPNYSHPWEMVLGSLKARER
jgi:hypothetical protein